jgi:hypothetical protein
MDIDNETNSQEVMISINLSLPSKNINQIIEIKQSDCLYHHDPNKIIGVSNFSFEYTGRHDNGPMAQLRHDSYYTSLIGGLVRLKTECEGIMSSALQQEVENDGISVIKKARLAEDDVEEPSEL